MRIRLANRMGVGIDDIGEEDQDDDDNNDRDENDNRHIRRAKVDIHRKIIVRK